MNFNITIHPIDRPLLEKLGIYDSGIIQGAKLIKVPAIMQILIEHGYTQIQSGYIEDWDQLNHHMTKERDQNGNCIN